MQKLGRNYSLTITSSNLPNGPIVVSLPFTLEFDITRNTLTSANVCQLRLYNLSATNRNALRRNVTSGWSYPLETVTLQAGYGTNLPIIFSGNVSQAWSVREGTNFITQLECFDAGFSYVNAQVPENLSSYPKGSLYRDIIIDLINSIPDIKIGVVGSYPGSLPRQTTYNGNTFDILSALTGGGFFVDHGIGNALGNNEYSAKAPASIINAATGLLNTPILENNIVRFNMIFEPSLDVGSGVQLSSTTFDSTIFQNYTGFYKITSVKHRGMISATVCGDAITTGEFFFLKSPVGVESGE